MSLFARNRALDYLANRRQQLSLRSINRSAIRVSGTKFRYSVKPAAAGIDPLGFAWGPFAYAAGQVLMQAVAETKSLDHDKPAAYMHKAKFNTVAGDFSFAQDGEWSQTRQVWTQFQNVQPNNLDQFRDGKVQPIVWPIESKTGNVIYPYADARKK